MCLVTDGSWTPEENSALELGMTVSRKAAILLAFAIVLALGFFSTTIPQSTPEAMAQPAETILVHGKLYTVSAKQPWAQAVAIRNERIIAVGDDAEIEK